MDRPDISPFVDVLEAWLRDNADDVQQLLGSVSDWLTRFALTWDRGASPPGPASRDHSHDVSLCPNPREVTKYGDAKRSYVCGCVPESL